MALKDRLSEMLARPAGHVVEASVREIVQDALKQGSVATTGEMSALREELSQAIEQTESLETRLNTLAEAVAALQTQSDAHAASAQQAHRELEQALSELASARMGTPPAKTERPADAETAAAKTDSPADSKTEKATPPKTDTAAEKPKGGRKSLIELGCKVADCSDPHRSKGFCSRHYQQWRRGRLEGFVGPEGYVQSDERSFKVATALQGQAAQFSGKGKRLILKVDGKKVEFSELE